MDNIRNFLTTHKNILTHSLTVEEPLGKFKTPITNHISNYNISKGVSETQYNSLNIELTLQK